MKKSFKKSFVNEGDQKKWGGIERERCEITGNTGTCLYRQREYSTIKGELRIQNREKTVSGESP